MSSALGHIFQNKQERGHGKWLQCSICGATQHSGFYWLHGWKSLQEPPCVLYYEKSAVVAAWRAQAEPCELPD